MNFYALRRGNIKIDEKFYNNIAALSTNFFVNVILNIEFHI